MPFLKFSLLVLFSSYVYSFSGTDCFNESYDVNVVHKSFPFGLLTKSLGIKKKGCELIITHNQYKYMNSKWLIDVCRNPVHIKTESGSVEVLRKVEKCTTVKSDFCNQYNKVVRLLEDDGLIFAKGLKSDLNADHGRVYCAYTLVNEYLKKDRIFNIGHNYDYLTKKIATSPNDADETTSFKVDPESGKADF